MEKTKEPNENEIRRMAASRSCENDEMMDPELYRGYSDFCRNGLP